MELVKKTPSGAVYEKENGGLVYELKDRRIIIFPTDDVWCVSCDNAIEGDGYVRYDFATQFSRGAAVNCAYGMAKAPLSSFEDTVTRSSTL